MKFQIKFHYLVICTFVIYYQRTCSLDWPFLLLGQFCMQLYVYTEYCMVLVKLPSVLIRSDVLTSANKVALNMTVPSLFRGMFIDTRRCNMKSTKIFKLFNPQRSDKQQKSLIMSHLLKI